jgi:DNA-binding NtrC family response regulator
LLYRINIAHVRLPPLRERPGDIMPLADYFLRTYSQRMDCKQPSFSEESIKLMLKYAWPGNIRELENVIHFALLVSGEETIRAEHLKVTGGWENLLTHRQPNWGEVGTRVNPVSPVNTLESPLDVIAAQLRKLFKQGGEEAYFDSLESLIVHEAFDFSNQNQVHTAALLGISRNVMRTLLKRHGLLRDSSYEDKGQDADNLMPAQQAG